jgi:hypothetical protein
VGEKTEGKQNSADFGPISLNNKMPVRSPTILLSCKSSRRSPPAKNAETTPRRRGGGTTAGKLAKEHILKAKQIDKARPGHSPREERKWRIGSQGKQKNKTGERRRGFLHNKRETKFPNGELWEQFEPKVLHWETLGFFFPVLEIRPCSNSGGLKHKPSVNSQFQKKFLRK